MTHATPPATRVTTEVRARALEDMRRFEVVMDGHFDYGNGFHGKLYLNPHQLFQWPSTIWRVAQDLIDVMPADFIEQTEIVAGPATGGALLAHTMAGLLDGRRPMTHPPYLFAPFGDDEGRPTLSPFYAKRMSGKRVLIVDDVRNTGTTFKRCADLVAGGRRHRDRHDADHRSLRSVREPRRAERRAGGIQGAAELSRGVVPDVRGRRAGHGFLIAEHRHDIQRHRDEQQVLEAEQHRAVFGQPAEHRAGDVGAERAIGFDRPARTTPRRPRRQTGSA